MLTLCMPHIPEATPRRRRLHRSPPSAVAVPVQSFVFSLFSSTPGYRRLPCFSTVVYLELTTLTSPRCRFEILGIDYIFKVRFKTAPCLLDYTYKKVVCVSAWSVRGPGVGRFSTASKSAATLPSVRRCTPKALPPPCCPVATETVR
ncbi:hypothetical protein NQ318_013116 [Aromia moschata]|uniref:Uncharacterized protein n=1 Tax=Aromia moschata TaxID=1265417 RepID=A0AAV8XBY9_9CUCU|nr:hypothetical protein NQ318_013116 [Aromia moschata]